MLRQHGAFKTYTSETLDMLKEKHMDAVLQEVAKQAGKDGAALVIKVNGNNGNNSGNRSKTGKNNKKGNSGNGSNNGASSGSGGAGGKPAPAPRS